MSCGESVSEQPRSKFSPSAGRATFSRSSLQAGTVDPEQRSGVSPARSHCCKVRGPDGVRITGGGGIGREGIGCGRRGRDAYVLGCHWRGPALFVYYGIFSLLSRLRKYISELSRGKIGRGDALYCWMEKMDVHMLDACPVAIPTPRVSAGAAAAAHHHQQKWPDGTAMTGREAHASSIPDPIRGSRPLLQPFLRPASCLLSGSPPPSDSLCLPPPPSIERKSPESRPVKTCQNSSLRPPPACLH
jgi:hypothetical protein